jgi:hypothetical protein
MAEALDIEAVRLNTGQAENTAPYTDEYIGGLIDASSVEGASAAIWRSLAASYSTKVDVTEAGASHKFSDLFKNAQAMAKQYEGLIIGITPSTPPRVNTIVRES